jgi:hypothetical protein
MGKRAAVGTAYRTGGGLRAASALLHLDAVAQPLRTPAEDEAPPVDPVAIHRNYRLERARRRARDERRREHRRANRRFRLVMLGLLIACAVLAVSVWQEIERLFGL